MTDIEYLDRTWNVTHGCSPASEGCKLCWAKPMAHRLRGRYGYDADEPFRVTCRPDRLDQPRHWRKPSRIGVSFMGDLFHREVGYGFAHKVFSVMLDERCSHHTFLVLTKRVDRMAEFFQTYQSIPAMPRVLLGVTAENQSRYDERAGRLAKIRAGVHVVSVEPMLGPVNIFNPVTTRRLHGEGMQFPHWVLCGGESRPGCRPMDPDWARSLRDQCRATGVAFFMKQMGGHPDKRHRLEDLPEDLRVREFPGGVR